MSAVITHLQLKILKELRLPKSESEIGKISAGPSPTLRQLVAKKFACRYKKDDGPYLYVSTVRGAKLVELLA